MDTATDRLQRAYHRVVVLIVPVGTHALAQARRNKYDTTGLISLQLIPSHRQEVSYEQVMREIVDLTDRISIYNQVTVRSFQT